MNFCHIVPTPHLSDFCPAYSIHNFNPNTYLVLAHLVEQDQRYTEFFANMKRSNPEVTLIMDNSAFEMYKRGMQMYPSEKLIEMGKAIHADYIVLSDYPDQPRVNTIHAAEILAPKFLKAGFKTFFVPQSKIGDLDDLVACFDWALHSSLIDYIGFSILNIPNAYGVESDNKLQRYLSRYHFVQHLETVMKTKYNKTLEQIRAENGKLFHFLGMVDGPNEIDLINTLDINVATWDSSAAVWAGLNGIAFDNSPTGLIRGKFEKEVNFNFYTSRQDRIQIAKNNIQIINDKAARAK